jgi:hypothetical protein
MTDAMHGPGTSQRMHAMEGAEEMMDRCSKAMDPMGDMGTPGRRHMTDRR